LQVSARNFPHIANRITFLLKKITFQPFLLPHTTINVISDFDQTF
jgi:hypothetical protein